jgi:rhodanese-related sulfurtransferase
MVDNSSCDFVGTPDSSRNGAQVRSFSHQKALGICLSLLATFVPALSAVGSLSSGAISQEDSHEFSVDRNDFEDRRLAWSYFQALAQRPDVLIIDVRSGFLPPDLPPGLPNIRPIPLEIFLPNFVARKVHQDKTLLIFDESGHELHRLQFNLQKNGYDDYFFLEGGAEAALGHQNDGS